MVLYALMVWHIGAAFGVFTQQGKDHPDYKMHSHTAQTLGLLLVWYVVLLFFP